MPSWSISSSAGRSSPPSSPCYAPDRRPLRVPAADRPVSPDRAAPGSGHHDLHRRRRPECRRDGHHADRAADQRHQGADLLQLRQHQQRPFEHRGDIRRRLFAGHRRGRHPEQGADRPAPASSRGQAVRRHDQEDVDRHRLRRQPLLEARHEHEAADLRRELPRQLRPGLRRRRVEADRGRQRRHRLRPQVRDADLARPGQDVDPVDPSHRGDPGDPAGEPPGRRRQDRRPAGSEGSGVRVPDHRQGPAREGSGVRGDHRPAQRRRLDRPRQGPRHRRALVGELRDRRVPRRPARRRHAGLSVFRRQRARDRRAGPHRDGAAQEELSRRARLSRSPTTPRCTSARTSTRSGTRWSRRSCS